MWGTVCDDGWTTVDANVACRQLGLSNSGIHVYIVLHAIVLIFFYPTTPICADAMAYTFGQGSTLPVVIDGVSCCGTESRLIDCAYDSHTSDCSHSEDAGVRCQPGWLTSF